MEKVENKVIVNQYELDASPESRTHIVNMLRKTSWEEFDTSIDLNKWYRFKLNNVVSLDRQSLMETHTVTIEYERLPECTISICNTIESDVLIPEKSFWKRFKNALKYLFKGGEDDVSSRR